MNRKVLPVLSIQASADYCGHDRGGDCEWSDRVRSERCLLFDGRRGWDSKDVRWRRVVECIAAEQKASEATT